MKINKKVSALALGLTLLLGIGAPMAVHASSCHHSPQAEYYTVTYTMPCSFKKNCRVTFEERRVKGVCVICRAVLGDNYVSSHQLSHSMSHPNYD